MSGTGPVRSGNGETRKLSVAECWEQAGGDRQRYRDLLHEHGHLPRPGDPGYDPDAPRSLPCGWVPGSRREGQG